ncbi:MAG TPA: TIGR03067 domain-containing protein [Mucilaginibacter sp.]|nr:TIGR03067 domain-containing protein [Mucilaginibacter sp.]
MKTLRHNARTASCFFLMAICFCCLSWKSALQQEKLDGTWIPVKQEMNGKTLPAAAFKGQKLVIADSTYTFTAESVDKGVVKRDQEKMDIYGREGVNAGRHFTAIWKLENGQLSICYNLAGDAYPAAFDTQGRPTYFLCVYEKSEN